MIDDLNHRHDVRLLLDDTLYYDISGVKLSWVKDGRNGHHTDGEAIEDELFVPHEYVRIQKK